MNIPTQKRGRPKKHVLDKLRTRMWFDEMSYRAGDQTPYWFWKTYSEGKGDKSTWRNYKSGDRTPRSINGEDVISKMDSIYPHVSYIFKSDIWEILKGEKLNEFQVSHFIKKVGPPLDTIILRNGYFWQGQNRTIEQVCYEIFELSGMNRFRFFEGIIFLLAICDSHGNIKVWNKTVECYHFYLPELLCEDHIPLQSEFLDVIDDYAQIRVQKNAFEYDRVFKPWRDQVHKSEILARKKERELKRAHMALAWKYSRWSLTSLRRRIKDHFLRKKLRSRS